MTMKSAEKGPTKKMLKAWAEHEAIIHEKERGQGGRET